MNPYFLSFQIAFPAMIAILTVVISNRHSQRMAEMEMNNRLKTISLEQSEERKSRFLERKENAYNKILQIWGDRINKINRIQGELGSRELIPNYDIEPDIIEFKKYSDGLNSEHSLYINYISQEVTDQLNIINSLCSTCINQMSAHEKTDSIIEKTSKELTKLRRLMRKEIQDFYV